MNAHIANHLTESQLYDLLTREPNLAAERHLNHCSTCQAEFASLRDSLSNFRLAATGLALAQPAFPHRATSASPRRSLNFFHFRPAAWASGLATAALVLAVSLSIERHPVSGGHQPIAVAAHPAAPNQSVSDEALLDDIDRDLANTVPSSLTPLAVPDDASGQSRN